MLFFLKFWLWGKVGQILWGKVGQCLTLPHHEAQVKFSLKHILVQYYIIYVLFLMS